MENKEFKCMVENSFLILKEGDKEINIGYNGTRMEQLKEAIKMIDGE